MTERGWVMRVGDGDDYHVESGLDGVCDRLRSHGIGQLVGTRTAHGVEAEGYRGENYISLFWGRHDSLNGSVPEQGLTLDEFAEINRRLSS